YTVSGTLKYTDQGTEVAIPLRSEEINVRPQAELELDYFLQRNVYSDDPFTEGVVETSVPFALGLLLQNVGAGDAMDLSITSAQPKIIENEKGLLIDFEIIGSSVNGEAVQPTLTADFGDVAAGDAEVATWLMQSTLQGKFIEYEVSFKHLNSLGIEELSLITETRIHELIKIVRDDGLGSDTLPDFLVNDDWETDPLGVPDTLYTSDMEVFTVAQAFDEAADGPASLADTEVQITATINAAGWNYVELLDPSDGALTIARVLREDGTEVNLENVWVTDRTFPAVGRPTYENVLHILDEVDTAGTATWTVIYESTNLAPVALNDVAATNEETAVIIGVLANDTDGNADALHISGVGSTANGTVTITAGGQIRYAPKLDFFGTDTFTYTVSDGNGGTSTAAVEVTVADVAEAIGEIRIDVGALEPGDPSFAPAPTGQAVEKNTGTRDVWFTLTRTAPATGAVAVTVAAFGTAGAGDIVAGAPTVVHFADGLTRKSFKLQVTGDLAVEGDETLGVRIVSTDRADVVVAAGGDDAVWTILNDDVANAAPDAVDDTKTTAEDTAIIFDPRANDTDANGDALAVTIVTGPAHGTAAVLADGTIRYLPSGDYNGADTLTYRISDGKGGTDTAVVAITVTPVNDAPVARADVAVTDEDVAAVINVRANDTDVDGDPLTIASIGSAAHGTVTEGLGGTLVYTPDADFHGTDSFSYTLADPGGKTGTATVTITVDPVNDAPRPSGDIRRVNNTQDVITVFENDIDPDGDAFVLGSVNGAPVPANNIILLPSGAGMLSLGGGAFTYVALGAGAGVTADAPAFDSFSYTLIDEHGAESAPVEVVLEIVPTVALGSQGPNIHMVGTTGGDVIMPYLGADKVDIGQGGLDVVAGTAADLAGDVIHGIDDGDAIRIDAAWLAVADIAFDGRFVTVDGGAMPDWQIDLGTDMPHGRFVVSQSPSGTELTFQRIDPVAQVVSLSVGTTAMTVTLDHAFVNPVAFALAPSLNDGDPVMVRIIAVVGDQVTLKLQEPNAADGVHGLEDVTLFVVEAGTHTLADGTVLQAGLLITNKMVARGFESVAFADSFDAAPAIFSQTQTTNGRDYVVTRQTGGSTDGFRVSMQEEEGNDFHTPETIGWMAIEQGIGDWSGLAYSAGSLTNAVNGNPTAGSFGAGFADAPNMIASLSSYRGVDPVAPRTVSIDASGFTATAQEDTSFDAETNHGRESLDWLALGGEGMLYAGAGASVIPGLGSGVVMAETGRITLNHLGATVTLAHAFANPVVIASVNTVNGAQEVVARISDVTSGSFFVALQEPDYLDGSHAWEQVSFMVVEAGSWRLPDGSVITAGTAGLSNLSSASFQPITFDAAFDSAPSVVAQVQTLNDAGFVKARIDGRDAAGFGLALEEEEAQNGGTHGAETVGWVALDRGPGAWNTNDDVFVFEAGTHVAGSGGSSDAFAAGFAAAPVMLGGVASAADLDAAELRMSGLTSLGVNFRVEKDKSSDSETGHAAEQIDWIAIGGEGLLFGELIV
ncbi:MAG: hypothetical protein ACI95R_003010, partial [Halioglobus sp.]